MSAFVPQLAGTLESTPFGSLLVRALDEHLTGTLVLEEPAGFRHGIFFEAGTPSRVRLASHAAHLGDVLVESGALGVDVCERTLERAFAEGVLHGQILLEEGHLTDMALARALSEQISRQVGWLFGQPEDTRFGYFEDKNFLANWGRPTPCENPLEVVWRGLRDHARAREIEAVILELGWQKLELIEGLPSGYFDFMGDDRAIVERLRGRPNYVSGLIEHAPGRESRIKRVICFLALTRAIKRRFPTAPPPGMTGGSEALVIPRGQFLPRFSRIPAARGLEHEQ